MNQANKTKNNIFARSFIVFVSVAGVLTVTTFSLSFVLSYNKEAIIPTSSTSATTKLPNVTQFAIGQLCQYNNQCPDKAFCSGTCKCPKNFYYNETSGICIIRKTFNAVCNQNYECNIVVGLSCQSSRCLCGRTQFWNTTYYSGLGMGIQLGKCQKQKTQGMPCVSWPWSVTTEMVHGTLCRYENGAQVNRAQCGFAWWWQTEWYHDWALGTCTFPYKTNQQACNHPNECSSYNYNLCYKAADGVRRTFTIPTIFWRSGYHWKRNFGSSCSFYNSDFCNEWRNLACSNSICQCYDKYYYYNSTMCVYGNRYGESCTATAQCTPTTASMLCDVPFTGAIFKVCRCSTSQYYDSGSEKCVALRNLNESCKDSSECVGNSNHTMFCGVQPGASQKRCMCSDGFYGVNATCLSKASYNAACGNTYECYDSFYQTCSTNCVCATGMYYDSNDNFCKYQLYTGDSCTAHGQCWSGTCSSFKCS